MPISYEYKSGGKVYGIDTATAIPTKTAALNSLTQRQTALEKKKR
jgi:hypothetical protein